MRHTLFDHDTIMRFFASVARNLEPVLADELKELGLKHIKPTGSGVWFQGGLEDAYRACLWSRVASSVLLHLEDFPASSTDELYEGVKAIDWSEHLQVRDTFAVQVTASRATINHTHFAALRVKDAIVDQFREKHRSRPSVDLDDPDLYIHLHLNKDQATISIDLSGKSLHRRGWRVAHTLAHIKENLAAAILRRARWHELCGPDFAFLDPMCGSGTFALEAWMVAADIAPGLGRDEGFGLETWLGHDRHAWRDLLAEARERKQIGLEKKLPAFVAHDKDHGIIKAARENIHQAGAEKYIRIQQREMLEVKSPAEQGLIATNPPYGERMNEFEEAKDVHERLGSVMIDAFMGWKAAVITGSKELGMAIPLRAIKRYSVFNGPLSCSLLIFDINQDRIYQDSGVSPS